MLSIVYLGLWLTIPAWPPELCALSVAEQLHEHKTSTQSSASCLETTALLPTGLLREVFFPA